MAKFINRIEHSLESDSAQSVSDILAAIAFLATMGACLTWFSF